MTKEKAKRTSKTTDERVQILDEKIENCKNTIRKLEAQKKALLSPKPLTLKTVISKAKESGLTAEQIAKKLGIIIE